MKTRGTQNIRMARCVKGGNALYSRAVLCEVELNGVPEPSMSEVASTA